MTRGFSTSPQRRRRMRLFAGPAVAAFVVAWGGMAFAQSADAPIVKGQAGAPDAQPASGQVDPRLMLELMVQKGLVSRADADNIIRRSTVQPVIQASAAPVAEPGVKTIPYIPAPVRDEIKDELRSEVRQEAKSEGWGNPSTVPDWLSRFTLSGDVRVRAEGVVEDGGNFDQFPNFNAINTGTGFDVSPSNPKNPPFLNTTKDRFLPRVRARLDVQGEVNDWINVELRLATGNDSSPVSPNQTLGGGNGDFSKYSLWLDRADVRLTPLPGLRIDLGRFANPFWTTDLLFYNDLNFDGAAAQYRHALPFVDGVTGFGSVGVFPLENTALNFGSNDVGAFSSRDKYLGAVQAGAEWRATPDIKLTAAASYFDFGDLQGKFSAPCLFSQDACNTDDSRPLFQQFGNSVIPIRTIVPDPAAAPGTSPEVQYFGLASKFQVLELHGQVDVASFDPVLVRLEGEYVRNMAFDRSDVAKLGPVNNFGDGGNFEGGGNGWFTNLVVGKPDLKTRGDWLLSAGYKFVKSDAVPDAFNDPDFHLGGTNAEGFILGAGYAFAENANLMLRWLSAREISGPPYANNVIQLDLNTRF
jgi:hypothetical protein